MPLNKSGSRKQLEIYLLNDNDMSFSHVIKSLTNSLPECSSIRAEQIAAITHNTGKCHIYTGKVNVALLIQKMLLLHKLKIVTKFK